MLAQSEIDFLAQKAQWYVDCEFKLNRGNYNPFDGDTVVLTGDGVDDLDRIIGQMTLYPYGRYLIDVGKFECAWRPVTVDDLIAIRAAYVLIWGTVNKPELPEDDLESVAFALPLAPLAPGTGLPGGQIFGPEGPVFGPDGPVFGPDGPVDPGNPIVGPDGPVFSPEGPVLQ